MNKYLLVLLTLISVGCQPKDKLDNTHADIPNKKELYRTDTKVFGDSLKVISEFRGDTIYQQRIDLKGRSDDNFDGSFNVMIVWSTLSATELKCDQILKNYQTNVEFNFCLNDVIKKIENDLITYSDNPWKIMDLERLKTELYDFKHGKLKKLDQLNYYLNFDLIKEIAFSAYDRTTETNVEKVRIEKYETSFSGGRNYYLINKQNDTIARFAINEWMK